MRPRQARQFLTIENTQPSGPDMFKLGHKDKAALYRATTEDERNALIVGFFKDQARLIRERAGDAYAECLAFDRLPKPVRDYVRRSPRPLKAQEIARECASVGASVMLIKLRRSFTRYVTADDPLDTAFKAKEAAKAAQIEAERRQHQGAA